MHATLPASIRKGEGTQKRAGKVGHGKTITKRAFLNMESSVRGMHWKRKGEKQCPDSVAPPTERKKFFFLQVLCDSLLLYCSQPLGNVAKAPKSVAQVDVEPRDDHGLVLPKFHFRRDGPLDSKPRPMKCFGRCRVGMMRRHSSCRRVVPPPLSAASNGHVKDRKMINSV